MGIESEETRGGAICNTGKIKISWRYVGDPGFRRRVGEDIGVQCSLSCW